MTVEREVMTWAPDFVVQDARILIADDVADTGHTLESVQEFCAGKDGEVGSPSSTRRRTR